MIIQTLLNYKDYSIGYKVKKIAAFICIVAILALITVFIGCPFYFVTHIICPGCGITRSFLAFFSLDIKEAFIYHPLFPLVLFAAITLIVKTIRYIKRENKNFFSFTMRDLEIILSQIMSHTSAKVFLVIFIALFVLLYIGRLSGFIPYVNLHQLG